MTEQILLTADTCVEVSADGELAAPTAEGTLAIVMYGMNPNNPSAEKAVRIPRLLQSDLLLNFHVAEISFHEGRQAESCNKFPGVLGANQAFRFQTANTFTNIPGFPGEPCFVGLYLSPSAPYQLCLVSESRVWPSSFDDYLTETLKGNGEQLFREIADKVGKSEAERTFSNLLFLPKRGQQDAAVADDSLLTVVSRDDLDAMLAKKETGGWWFNLPVAIYSWMTASLERLLSGYIDEDESQTGTSLRDWDDNLRAWFQLLSNLTVGLKYLHAAGAIHGDARPANIMTYIQPRTNITEGADVSRIEPDGFRWIDVGLGYGSADALNNAPSNEQSGVTPRPLGGGRATVFYAPERIESTEFEDADVVKLIDLSTKDQPSVPKKSRLEFFWRHQTHLSEIPLPLKDTNGVPIRELGKLSPGDRVQVREFLFEVDEVQASSIEVSKIYEVFLDRVLVEKVGVGRTQVHNILNKASISRYRIFKQWSQATDLYGLGVITLYLFFIRGLYLMKNSPIGMSDKNPVYARANREMIFEELAVLLRNRSFLETLLSNIERRRLSHSDLLKRSFHGTNSGAAEIADLILATDYNFEFVWYGLNANDGLFVQVIYFCLCCVWRQEEVKEMGLKTAFDFGPFSESRLMIDSKKDRSAYAEKARAAIESILYGMGDVEHPEGAPKHLLGSFREGDFKNPSSFIVKLRDGSDPLSAYLLTLFTPETQQLLSNYDGSVSVTKSLRRTITKELNELLGVHSIYDDGRFTGVGLTEELKSLIAQEPTNEDLARLNRLLLEAAYPEDISKGHALGSSRADQIISLREDLSEANDRIEAEKKIVTDICKQLAMEQEDLPEHGVMWGGYDKIHVDTIMKRLSQVACSRSNPSKKVGEN